MKKIQHMFISGGMFVLTGAMVIAPFSASAVTLGERDETAIQSYRDARTTYRTEVQKYTEARADYVESRNDYRNNRTDEKLQVALDDAKVYLLQSGDSAISYLQMLRTKVSSMRGISEGDRTASLNEIDEDIAWMQSKKIEVQNATTREQLTSLGQQISQRWDEVQASSKRIVGTVLAARINYILGEMNSLSTRVDAKIAVLAAEGADVTELNRLNASFKANIALGETAYDNAIAKFNAISDLSESNTLFNEGRSYIRDADAALRAAHADLREIVKEIKTTTVKTADVSGKGVLEASGSGYAKLTGAGTVVGTTDTAGYVLVTDKGGDAQFSGSTGNRETLPDGRIRFTSLTGDLTVTGSDVIVEVSGSEISFEANGTGVVELKGEGTFTTGGSSVKRNFTATPIQIQIAK